MLLVDWYYLQQQREQVQLVPAQVEIRFLNSFGDVVCLKLLGSVVGVHYLPSNRLLGAVVTHTICDR